MTTAHTVPPPMGEMYMIGIWIETVLYGINCVMYVLSMFILLYERNVHTRHRLLPVMTTILFLLCTAHVGASLQQLLDAFVFAPHDVPNYSTTYWLNYTRTPIVLKGILYGTLVLSKDVIQIWRLYVVFMHNWRIVVLPIMLLAGSVGCAYAASVVPVLVNDDASTMTPFIISACTLAATIDVLATAAIVARLWSMGRKIASLTGTSTNRYASSMYIVIESGTICAVFSTFIVVLFASGSHFALVALDIAAQLDVLVPLLIVVQVGKTERGRTSESYSSRMTLAGQDKIVFQPGGPREQDTLLDFSHHVPDIPA